MNSSRNVLLSVVSQLVVAGSVVLCWQCLVIWGGEQTLFLPGPLDVARSLGELWASGALVEHAAASIVRVLAGFGLATLFAVPVGLALGWYRRTGAAFSLVIEVARTISPIAWIPLAVLWFGIGDRPAVFIIFMAAVFPILVATMHAPRQMDPVILKTAVNLGARGRTLLVKVIFPGSLPFILVGLRIALGVSWVVVVAAEMVGMQSGLGFLILDARNFLRTDMVIAGMLVIGAVGFTLDLVMRFCESRVRSQTGVAFNAAV